MSISTRHLRGYVYIIGCGIGNNTGEAPSDVRHLGVDEGIEADKREIRVGEKGFHHIREGRDDIQDHGVGNAHIQQARP